MNSDDYKLLVWDWKDVLDVEKLAKIVLEFSNGTVHIREVETDGDAFAIIISKTKIDDDTAERLYDERI